MSQNQTFISLEQSKPPYFAGVDLGGTNVKVGVVDDEGRSLSRLSIPTEGEQGAERSTRRMGDAVKEAVARAGLQPSDVARVGFGCPGTIDIPAGKFIVPVNIPGESWHHFPVRDRLAEHSGYEVSFLNDAAAAAYGEYWIGSGKEYTSLMLLTLGTGIGCGIIVHDLNIAGEHSHGAECGHIIIDYHESGRLCGCGKRGHFEAYASATAMTKLAEEALENGRQTSVRGRLAAGEELTPKLLAEEAAKGDAFSLERVQEQAKFLAVGIVSLAHTVDPSAVLLGGAMTFGGKGSSLGEQFLAWIKEEINRRAFPIVAENLILDFATLGGDAGYIGAAGTARADFYKKK